MCYISEYSTGNVPEIIVRQKVYCKTCHKGMGTIQDVDEPLERQLGQYVSLTTGPVPLNRPTPQLCRFLNLFPLVNGPIFPTAGPPSKRYFHKWSSHLCHEYQNIFFSCRHRVEKSKLLFKRA